VMFDTQDYWVFWTSLSSGILETRKHDVSETESVSILRGKGGEDTYSVGPLRKSLRLRLKLRLALLNKRCFFSPHDHILFFIDKFN
jgi:hypothetical protein